MGFFYGKPKGKSLLERYNYVGHIETNLKETRKLGVYH
jgi:hypothetical protein